MAEPYHCPKCGSQRRHKPDCTHVVETFAAGVPRLSDAALSILWSAVAAEVTQRRDRMAPARKLDTMLPQPRFAPAVIPPKPAATPVASIEEDPVSFLYEGPKGVCYAEFPEDRTVKCLQTTHGGKHAGLHYNPNHKKSWPQKEQKP